MFPGKTKILFSQATFISTSNQFCFKVVDQRDPTLWITLIRRWRWSRIRHWIFNIAKRWYKFNVVSSWPQHKVTFIKALQNKVLINNTAQKQLSRGVLSKSCSENMRQIYRITPMPKCYFNKVAKQINKVANKVAIHTSAWVFSCKFNAYFQNTSF